MPCYVESTLPALPHCEGETKKARGGGRASTGRSSGESYAGTLKERVPGAVCELVKPVEADGSAALSAALSDCDAVFPTGSPLHVDDDTPEVRRQLDSKRAVFASGTPSFDSCAGLQVAVTAAGGSVREKAVSESRREDTRTFTDACWAFTWLEPS